MKLKKICSSYDDFKTAICMHFKDVVFILIFQHNGKHILRNSEFGIPCSNTRTHRTNQFVSFQVYYFAKRSFECGSVVEIRKNNDKYYQINAVLMDEARTFIGSLCF